MFTLAVSSAKAQTPILFADGSDSGVWAGYVTSGQKNFSLRMAKGQRLWIRSNEVNTWSLVTPACYELGCRGYSYCPPNDDEGLLLPESGTYTIRTTYRMSGAANGPFLTQRYVGITFTVR
jgi:hypothetical protein